MYPSWLRGPYNYLGKIMKVVSNINLAAYLSKIGDEDNKVAGFLLVFGDGASNNQRPNEQSNGLLKLSNVCTTYLGLTYDDEVLDKIQQVQGSCKIC